MRTNIDIDDELLAEAMRIGGFATKKAAVEDALHQLLRGYRQKQAIENMRGMGWEGDLEAMRTDLD